MCAGSRAICCCVPRTWIDGETLADVTRDDPCLRTSARKPRGGFSVTRPATRVAFQLHPPLPVYNTARSIMICCEGESETPTRRLDRERVSAPVKDGTPSRLERDVVSRVSSMTLLIPREHAETLGRARKDTSIRHFCDAHGRSWIATGN